MGAQALPMSDALTSNMWGEGGGVEMDEECMWGFALLEGYLWPDAPRPGPAPTPSTG